MEKNIEGYKYYYVTDTGEVYSKDRQVTILNPNTKKNSWWIYLEI